jgi:hypothetical protein
LRGDILLLTFLTVQEMALYGFNVAEKWPLGGMFA